MKESILMINGVQALGKAEQKAINGGRLENESRDCFCNGFNIGKFPSHDACVDACNDFENNGVDLGPI